MISVENNRSPGRLNTTHKLHKSTVPSNMSCTLTLGTSC